MNECLRDALIQTGRVCKERVPTLNCGGCGVFASAVAEVLAKHQVPVEVIYCRSRWYERDFDDQTPLREFLRNPNEDNIPQVVHMGVRLEIAGRKYTYDSEALHQRADKFSDDLLRAEKETLTPQETLDLVKIRYLWNSVFPRRHISTIRRIVREHLDNPILYH